MRSDYIKKSVYDRIYNAMQYENMLAVQLSIETGARIGDIVSLRTDNLKKNTIKYIASKTGKEDKKVISAELAKRLRKNASGGYLFPSTTSSSGHRTRQAVWTDIKKAAKLCGIKSNVSPHSARKTYAVEDYHRNGLNKAQADLQHDNLNTTLLYVLSDQLSGGGTPAETHGTCSKCCFDCDEFIKKLTRNICDTLVLLFQESKNIN